MNIIVIIGLSIAFVALISAHWHLRTLRNILNEQGERTYQDSLRRWSENFDQETVQKLHDNGYFKELRKSLTWGS